MLWNLLWIMVGLLATLAMAWASLALWVHQSFSKFTNAVIACIWIVVLVLAFYGWALALAGATAFFAATAVWFFAKKASNARMWQDEFAHQYRYSHQGRLITIDKVRAFEWHGENDFTPKWLSKTYDLAKLDTLDLVLTTWGNENIAHMMMSFGFSDGQKLIFSVETRKEVGEEFSTIGGFFRLYELCIIAGLETDLIFTRTNIRQEQVTIYPLTYPKNKIKRLFLRYLAYGQKLHQQPKWYNSLTSNCTTVVFEMVRQLVYTPLDYRMIVSGRLPEYLHEHGVIDQKFTIKSWRSMGFANPLTAHLGKICPNEKTFSAIIRQNLPNNAN